MWQNLKNSKTRVRKPSSNSTYNYLRSRKLIILNLIFFPSWKLLSSLIFYDSSRTSELALLWAGIRLKVQFSSVQSLTHVQLFVAPWTAARQASLSITNSQSLLKPMFIESVMPSSHRILCRHLLSSPSENPINSMKRLKVYHNNPKEGNGGLHYGGGNGRRPWCPQHWNNHYPSLGFT